ncbi:MAG: hypothetical protein LUC26_00230 [Prevotella sp.]|nr:hypothetical protein [Prevotella sp.]
MAKKKEQRAQVTFTTEARVAKQGIYHFRIEFYVYPDNDVYIAYCPSLDLITCDKTFNEAISAFYEMFQLYVEGCVEDGTLHDDLIAHGWKVSKQKLTPPTLTTMLRQKTMKDLLASDKPFERVVSTAQIPAYV